MGRKERINIIKELQEYRGNKVICYVLGDRLTLETKMHSEILPYFYNILKVKEKGKAVDLFLYSTGGITTAAWGIANLLNEFSDHYNVLIPYKALSAATLVSLGAKEIVMTELGQLSPVTRVLILLLILQYQVSNKLLKDQLIFYQFRLRIV